MMAVALVTTGTIVIHLEIIGSSYDFVNKYPSGYFQLEDDVHFSQNVGHYLVIGHLHVMQMFF